LAAVKKMHLRGMSGSRDQLVVTCRRSRKMDGVELYVGEIIDATY